MQTAKIYNAAALAIKEETHRLFELYLEFCRPILIWKEDKNEKMPSSLLKDKEGAMEWRMARPIPVEGHQNVFVSNTNNLCTK